MREALLYEKLSNNRVRCNLCAHNCIIANGKRGVCQVRENRNGKLNTLVYGRAIAQHVDPIEKKPLFHFNPGTNTLSFGTPGCNFHCQWCQNWEISQMPHEKFFIFSDKASPEQIVSDAKKTGCNSIAYTYTEPTIFFEYAYDTAKLARKSGLENIIISNGYTPVDTF
jgi:pyruvate formate lyase activating enzyme